MTHRRDMKETLADLYRRIREQKVDRESAVRLLREFHARSRGQASRSNDMASAPAAASATSFEPMAVDYFKKVLAQSLKLPVDRIDADAPFEKYGIDSLMVMQMTTELEKHFGSLSKTLFFEYQNIASLVRHFLKAHRHQLIALLGPEQGTPAGALVAPVGAESNHRDALSAPSELRIPTGDSRATGNGPLDIAIIGISGRYPKARNVEEFWENLKAQRDCVTEIPADRWDYRLYFDTEKGKPGKAYCKWGGFIDDVDKFDPRFFGVSPIEAEIMEPQERLFLQCAYETLQDAGYTRESLKRYSANGIEGNVGVFVGVMYEEYQLYGAQSHLSATPAALPGTPSSIANRVSYFCNFHGPSFAVDTMCSSALTAIHLACESITNGSCELAIAGGVNVSIHPNKYLGISHRRFASSIGHCACFGAGGDGYVPGEGIGAVLLKPLAQAIEDNDQIYGVIKASSINHGGKTNGFTVPNPNAQAHVIAKALQRAGLHPRTISYIEAHGTGTALGDPIEITGLTKAFETQTTDTGFCAIGSAKSNIGHLESAAGIAGLTKVLLQMKYGTLVPILHAEVLNPNIDFAKTPFVVQREMSEWRRPVVTIDGVTREYPRIAGISSFGAGGSNAHLIVEEYIAPSREALSRVRSNVPVTFVLSARNAERLQVQARNLLRALQEPRFSDADLPDIGYTLQVGREAMESRLAFRATSLAQARETLEAFLAGNNVDGLWQGGKKRKQDARTLAVAETDTAKPIQALIENGEYATLLQAWVNGATVDWESLYAGLDHRGNLKPRRISLPTYPFVAERYWAPEADAASRATATWLKTKTLGGSPVLHPLLHQNTSDLAGQRYTSRFTGDEFFLKDHVVQGRGMLPGAVHLEMARAAIERAAGLAPANVGAERVRLENIAFMRPAAIDGDGIEMHIALDQQNDGTITFEIYSGHGDSTTVYSRGRAVIEPVSEPATLDVNSLKAQSAEPEIPVAECYRAFAQMGLVYGESFRGLRQVYLGRDSASHRVLAEIALPSSVSATHEEYFLHPSLIDAALQAGVGMILDGDTTQSLLPFALERLDIFAPTPERAWVVIRGSADNRRDSAVQKLDLDVFGEDGRVCVRLRGFSSRVLESARPARSTETWLLQPHWRAQTAMAESNVPAYGAHWVFLCDADEGSPIGDTHADIVATRLPGTRVVRITPRGTLLADRYTDGAIQLLHQVKTILAEKPRDAVLVQWVVPVEGDGALWQGLTGLLKSANQENPKLKYQMIGVEGRLPADSLVQRLQDEARTGAQVVRYRTNRREVLQLEDMANVPPAPASPWKNSGVYLITGGAGGLGRIVAQTIAIEARDVTLVLSGRSELDEARRTSLDILRSLGAKVEYRTLDVSDRSAVDALVAAVVAAHGKIDGVLHAAGVVRDAFVLKKTDAELKAVFAPKVAGLINLDQATRDLPLDHFVLFSSTAAMGNIGQADYAAANAFMDAYAAYRNELAAVGQRHGHAVSINWPLWAQGGMQIDAAMRERMWRQAALVPLENDAGIRALHQILALDAAQAAVFAGDRGRFTQLTSSSPAPAPAEAVKPTPVAGQSTTDTGELSAKVEAALFALVSEVLKIKRDEVEADAEFIDFGFDSVTLLKLGNLLHEKYCITLTPTAFFEYPSIRTLTEYLVDEHHAALAGHFAMPVSRAAVPAVSDATTVAVATAGDGMSYEATGELAAKVEAALIALVSEVLKITPEEVEVEEEFIEFGFDSVTLLKLGNLLHEKYGITLAPTAFFEYPSIRALVGYLADEHRAVFGKHLTPPSKPVATAAAPVPVKPEASRVTAVTPSRRRNRADSTTFVPPAADTPEPIAIVGMSGRFPQAKDLDEFWRNLKEGRDCVHEVPEERWPEAIEIRRAGVLDGVDHFDPFFFGITPREAEGMDPQQRLLMMYVWKAIEDAGYASKNLSGTKTALFIGTANSGYGALLSQAGVPIEGHNATSAAPSVGPNRMSYLLDLHGPSEPIETACSSALVAIHRAVTTLQAGQCEMAIAGGINLLIHPELHVSFIKAGMLSPDGACKTFSKDANGYVRGEGVGMLFLKKLSAAERDGDHIYGVIRASAENHGGRAASLTAPNPRAQAEVIKAAFLQAGVDPRTVNYIEAHGTGTPLGDPIEIQGLKSAFKELTRTGGSLPTGYCGIGSVKTNIGHLELAAGVAGVIKVLLQLKHKTLVKSLHCEEMNPYIQLSDTPFYIVRAEQGWQAPNDEQGRPLPRRAGISSFGFGGVNAHVVIEEYVAPESAPRACDVTPERPALLVLSAKNPDRLNARARDLLAAIAQGHFRDKDLLRIAYTLQVGRDPMECRLAFTATSLADAERKLRDFLESSSGSDALTDIRYGEIKPNKDALVGLNADDDTGVLVMRWLEKGKYLRLLDLWVKGLTFDWAQLYGHGRHYDGAAPERISLPTYPFAEERYWAIPAAPKALTASVETPAGNTALASKAGSDRVDIAGTLERILRESSGVENLPGNANLLELGFDSLMLLTMNRRIAAEIGVKIPIKQFVEELHTPDKLVAYLRGRLPVSGSPSSPTESVRSAGPTKSPNAESASMSDILEQLGQILQESSGIESLLPEANLFELGFDSLMLLTMNRKISSHFGVKIPIKLFVEELHTATKVAAYLAARLSDVESSAPAEMALRKSPAESLSRYKSA